MWRLRAFAGRRQLIDRLSGDSRAICGFLCRPARSPFSMAMADLTAAAALPTANNASLPAVMRSPKLLIRETLAGIVTALALIPEVISFSFVSGVDPKVALIASITLGLVMSVLGGRPAMVTAAAGSVALVIGPMVKQHGVEYILPTILAA